MATPTEWLNEFQVNTGTADIPGTSDPQVIGLSNGNILVAWVEAGTTGVATQRGADIVGKIFDAEGNLVEDSFRININRAVDDETDFDVAATNDGGFILVYVDNDLDVTTRSTVMWERFNAAGTQIDSLQIADENVAADFLANPQVAVSQATNRSYVTFTDDVGADTDIRGVLVSAAGTIDTAEFNAAQNSADFDGNGDSAILTNGELVTVYQETDGAITSIEAYIASSAGILQHNVSVTAAASSDPQVASLANGGFVVTWTEASDIKARVYDVNANPQTGIFLVASGANNQNEPEIAALPEGDFVVIWDDDTSLATLARRFNANGTNDGTTFTVDTTGNPTSPNVGVTSDGRILFTWSENNNVFTSIWDPRPATINAVDYDQGLRNFVDTEVITARTSSSTVNGDADANTILGQGGNDRLFGRGGVDTIFGGAGNDTILGGFSTDTVDGESGNDLIVVLNGEFFDNVAGGSGTDTLDHSNVTISGDTFDFATGQIFSSNDTGTPTLSGIEVYRDGSGGNTINDRVGNFTIFANAGNDTVNENVNGGLDFFDLGSGNDFLQINNTGIGGDTFNGGSGNDTISFNTISFGQGTIVNLSVGRILAPGGGSFELVTSFENVFGSNGSERITGNAGANDLRGNLGNDTVRGADGNDTVNGGAGNDLVLAGYGDDVASGGIGDDTVNGQTGEDTINGGAGNDSLLGSFFNDTVNGGDGDDFVDGGALDDFVTGGNGNDTVRGVTGNDSLLGGAGNDLLQAGNGIDTLRGGVGNDTLAGGLNSDLLVGNTGADNLQGQSGLDTLDGGAGNDILIGGANADSFVFANGYGRDTVNDFADDQDVLVLNDNLWGGGLSAQQVVNMFSTVVNGNTVLDFGTHELTVRNIANPNDLVDDIIIV